MIDQDKVVHPIAQYGTDIPPEYIIPPGGEPVPQEEYTEGVRPLDTLPAAWWNWLWNKITGGMRDAASMISSMYNELVNLLTEGGIPSPSTALDNQVASAVVNIHQRLATTSVPGSIKADSTTFGAIAVDGTTGVATMNGAGSGSFDTTAQSDITAAINELVSRVATLENAPAADSVPAGIMTAYCGETIPSGWLLCDGRALNRTTYATLFTAIGTKWGAGDGSTTFNLPDMREAVPVGTGRRASGVTNHDEYSLGQFKDDQLQAFRSPAMYVFNNGAYSLSALQQATPEFGNYLAPIVATPPAAYEASVNFYKQNDGWHPCAQACSDTAGYTDWSTSYWRYGKSTRTKQAGVNFIIKF